MNKPSKLIIKLQEAKTAIEAGNTWHKWPGALQGIDALLYDVYKHISDLIYKLEKEEDLPYNWRDEIEIL